MSSHDHAEAMRQQKVRATRNYEWEKICKSGLGRKATAVEGVIISGMGINMVSCQSHGSLQDTLVRRESLEGYPFHVSLTFWRAEGFGDP